ncbi:MAG: hypothetical protein JXR95_15330 [Deltaproteobacteria bacterium]|nr:hypothetical protein [Deltaproteobacteria bacterium]
MKDLIYNLELTNLTMNFIKKLQNLSLGKRIVLIVGTACLFLFIIHFISWFQATPIYDADILSAKRASPGYRDGTLRRYSLKVIHNSILYEGYMNTYWYTGKPLKGQRVSLKISPKTNNIYKFYYQNWIIEFSSWFIMLSIFSILTATYYLYSRKKKAKSHPPRLVFSLFSLPSFKPLRLVFSLFSLLTFKRPRLVFSLFSLPSFKPPRLVFPSFPPSLSTHPG